MLTIAKKSLKVGKFVTTPHVDNVIRNYKQERWIHNSKRIGKEDSLSIWYSAEELEEFLTKIKEYGADGVKFYFGAYPADYPEQPMYAARQTLVMVATKSKETAKGRIDKDIHIRTDAGTTILAYNAGKPCPPFCNPTIDNPDWDQIGIAIVDKGEDGMLVV